MKELTYYTFLLNSDALKLENLVSYKCSTSIFDMYYSTTPSLKIDISLKLFFSVQVFSPLAIFSTKSRSLSPASSSDSPSATVPALKSIQLRFFS